MIVIKNNGSFIVTRKEKAELKGGIYIASNYWSENNARKIKSSLALCKKERNVIRAKQNRAERKYFGNIIKFARDFQYDVTPNRVSFVWRAKISLDLSSEDVYL